MTGDLARAEQQIFRDAVELTATAGQLAGKFGPDDTFATGCRDRAEGLIAALHYLSGETDDLAREQIKERIQDAAKQRAATIRGETR